MLGNLELHQWAWIIGGFFALLSVVASIYVIVLHVKKFYEPLTQIFAVRIVAMVPVYVIGSYLSLIFKDKAFYFTLIRDCYEAYVLYMFFRLLIELANGEENLIQKLEFVKQIRCFMPMCCMHIKPGRIFLHRCKQMLLQFVILKPILAFLIFILSYLHVYDEGSFATNRGYLYITIIYNVSFTIALYFLVLFYEATKEILSEYKPIRKFLCIKAVIFFSYWQSIAVAILIHFHLFLEAKGDWSLSDVATGLQNFLICIEMFPLAVAHHYSFGWNSFRDPATLTKVHDEPIIKRIAEMANITDVIVDTVQALKLDPDRNVKAGNFLNLPRSQQRQHVLKMGWMSKRGEDLAKIWKKRFMCIIDEPRGMIYFDHNIFEEKPPNVLEKLLRKGYDPENTPVKGRGFIDMNTVTAVETHKSSLQRWTLVTTGRKWHFRCKERDEWIESVRGQLELMQKSNFVVTELEDQPEDEIMTLTNPFKEMESDFKDVGTKIRNAQTFKTFEKTFREMLKMEKDGPTPLHMEKGDEETYDNQDTQTENNNNNDNNNSNEYYTEDPQQLEDQQGNTRDEQTLGTDEPAVNHNNAAPQKEENMDEITLL